MPKTSCPRLHAQDFMPKTSCLRGAEKRRTPTVWSACGKRGESAPTRGPRIRGGRSHRACRGRREKPRLFNLRTCRSSNAAGALSCSCGGVPFTAGKAHMGATHGCTRLSRRGSREIPTSGAQTPFGLRNRRVRTAYNSQSRTRMCRAPGHGPHRVPRSTDSLLPTDGLRADFAGPVSFPGRRRTGTPDPSMRQKSNSPRHPAAGVFRREGWGSVSRPHGQEAW